MSSDSFVSDDSSIRSSSSFEARRYTSRFYEHISQAYTAPPEEFSFEPYVPPRQTHKHTRSVESFSTVSTTSTTSSMEKLVRFAFKWRRARKELKTLVTRGKKLRREDIKIGDIKVGALIASTNFRYQPEGVVEEYCT